MQVILHRICSWQENGKWLDLHGLRVASLPDCWSASMGLIVDAGCDPWMPDEDFACFVNEAQCVVLSFNHAWKPGAGNTPRENAELWFHDGWKWCQERWGHYELSIEEVQALPDMKDGINHHFPG